MADSEETSELIYKRLPIDAIRPSAYQARKVFTQASLESLAASIKAEGMLQAITVRPWVPPGEAGASAEVYEIISGERRWRACQLLGYPTIEAKILTTISEAEAAAKGLIENLQRDDLNPVEEAEGFHSLVELNDAHWTQEQIATVSGKEQSYISRSLSLLNLPMPILDFMRQRIISREHGIELMRIKDAKKQFQFAKKCADVGLSVQELRSAITRFLDPRTPKEHSAPPPAIPFVPAPPGTVPMGTVPSSHDPMEAVWKELKAQDSLQTAGSWTAGFNGSACFITAPEFKGGVPEIRQKLAAWLREFAHALEPRAPALKPQAAQVPVPQIKEVRYVESHRLLIRWDPVGEGYRYRIMRADDSVNYKLHTDDAVVATPGAVIDCRYREDIPSVSIAVIAVDPQANESELSQPVTFDLKPWNTTFVVAPLPSAR